MSVSSYEELNRYKGSISVLCDSTNACLAEFGKIYHNYKFDNVIGLKNLIGKIGQTNFKVVVIGKFSTGKSSLINTLLGEDVLPDSLSPCTAYINEIVYGEEKQATIYFKHPLPENWAGFVQNESVKEHIQKHCAGKVPEYVIPLEDLADCVTIPWDEDSDDVYDEKTDFDISPFEKAVIQYPCALCKNGIEIIDSPGLDESQDRTEIVDKYLNKVDAVIYVMTNIATGGDSDKEIIDKYLTQNDIKNVFFVCNLFGIPVQKAQKQLFGRLKKVFGDKTLLGERGIHLVNIRDMRNTGVTEFENALADYLNNEKGKAQLTAYVEQLTKIDTAIRDEAKNFACVGDVRLEAINNEIADLKERIAKAQGLLQSSQASVEEIKAAIDELCRKIVMEKLKKLSYTIRVDIKDRNDKAAELANTAVEAEAKKLAEVLASEYSERIEKDITDYTYQELTVSIYEEIEAKLQELQAKLNGFGANLLDQEIADSKVDLKPLSPVSGIVADNFAKALTVDLAQFVAYEPLGVGKLIDGLIKDIYIVCAGYQGANRGAKLTSEVQNRVSLEAYQKLEKLKRPMVEYLIQQSCIALDELEFNKIVGSMAKIIEELQQKLAARESLRLEILDQQKAEHNKSDEVLAQLNADLLSLVALQKEIDA